MTTALPKPSRSSSNGPPSMALPALPVTKTRMSSGLQAPSTPVRSLASTPKSGLRAPSSAIGPPPSTPAPMSALTQPRAMSAAVNGSPKSLRKTVSINSFPQPPRGNTRIGSLPPSPLSGNRKAKASNSTDNHASGTASLLNNSAEGKSVTRASARFSDGLISVSSPPQSRSSSAQDSYSTSATTYDEPIDATTAKTSTDVASKRQSKGDNSKGNVVVSVRVRPDAGSQDQRPDGEWLVDGRKALIGYRGKEGGDYYYDNVFATHDDNSRVYDHIAKRLVRRVMEGYHGTVFAYGMTGTGKTFSMQGTASSPGVIPLAITDIFSYIRETPSREFLLRVSYLEIYNEKIHDLLSMPTNGGVGGAAVQEEIKLREDSKRGVYASPLKEEIVQSPTQLLRVIARGDQARRTASTQFNSRSSRSHAVVQIVVESRERIPGGPAAPGDKRSGLLPGGVRVSTLSLIDLAGSEKAAETKERRQEGSHINKSLLTLGTVIAKISEHKDSKSDKDGKHLPYRDSKLTRLLQGALSGDSLVSILCTIQTGSSGSAAAVTTHTNETLNTLKFASRAKNNLVSHAKRAEEALGAGGEGGARVLLERYRMEIQELKAQLETQAKKDKKDKKEDDTEMTKDAEEELAREREAAARHEEQMLEMQLARTALKERIDHLNRLILSSKSIGVNASGTWSSLSINQRFSQASMRSSLTPSQASKPMLERSSSLASSASTIGQRPSLEHRISTSGDRSLGDEDDSVGEFGDGTASLQAQNRALQADLADKNRYITTLEKRLLQARRASSSRASSGTVSGSKGIMVGEDHSVSAALKEKDAEIAELRAQLEDKDRMLIALRSAARRGENAERSIESRASLLFESGSHPGSPASSSRPSFRNSIRSSPKDHRKSGDDVSRILDEMLQDRVEAGHIVRSTRGSVRVVNREKTIGEHTQTSRQSSESNRRPVVVEV
ncbi:Kinesin-related protein 11 [Cytospora mali]|uniref:Kinesin-like protein n=1 Tax=Cytospora mali TaxID=578113 RepID=A0A194VU62_CYTMA|nr:Kinesin-related protein 11 [Valsa mali]